MILAIAFDAIDAFGILGERACADATSCFFDGRDLNALVLARLSAHRPRINNV